MATKATTPRMTTTTMAPANKGIGWSRGTASQVSLPNMLIPRPNAHARTGCRNHAGVGLGDRAGTGRHRLVEDLFEQTIRHGLVGERLRNDALFGELHVALRGQPRSPSAHLAEPGVKVLWRL